MPRTDASDLKCKAMGLRRLKTHVRKLLQKAIRMEAADDEGYCTCVCCGSRHKWNTNQIDASHYVSVGSGSDRTTFASDNIHPCCKTCNRWLDGNIIDYTQFMLDTYGKEKVEALKLLRFDKLSYTRPQIMNMRDQYLARISVQKRRLK